jgi:hypothetical protein
MVILIAHKKGIEDLKNFFKIMEAKKQNCQNVKTR